MSIPRWQKRKQQKKKLLHPSSCNVCSNYPDLGFPQWEGVRHSSFDIPGARQEGTGTSLSRKEHPLKVRIDGMGEGPRGKEGKGEEERLCPLLPLQSFFPSLLQKLESVAVAVNAQLTPSYSPNILQNGAGGGEMQQ